MSSKSFTVNIDILTVNTVICHYNPHNSDKLFDFGSICCLEIVTNVKLTILAAISSHNWQQSSIFKILLKS